jgi:hypothetical protein
MWTKRHKSWTMTNRRKRKMTMKTTRMRMTATCASAFYPAALLMKRGQVMLTAASYSALNAAEARPTFRRSLFGVTSQPMS